MKSIRFIILQCLLQHGEQTLDDLQTQLSDIRRDKIYSNLQAAKSDEFVSSRKDVATNLPAYKITEKGKEYLVSNGYTVADAQSPVATENVADVTVQEPEPEGEIPVCCGAARVIATTAAEVSGEYRAQLEELKEQNRLLATENSALRLHSLMLGKIADITERFQQLGDDTTLGVVTAMVQRIADLESAVDLSQQTIQQHELEAEQSKLRIAALEANGDLLSEASQVSAPEAITASKPPFYISIGRDTGPQIHKEIEPATRRMKSIVRRGDKVGLVLVPILKAIPGVELVEVKAA